MKSRYLFANILFFLTTAVLRPQISDHIVSSGGQYYISNTIVIKLKNAATQDKSALQPTLTFLEKVIGSEIVAAEHVFNMRKSISKAGLDRIFMIKFLSDVDPQHITAKLKKLDVIEWAEPKYVYPVEYIPNDPFYSTQYALQKIKAADAWNISTGDTSIVIAIIDTGVDWDHPDLAANIWRNWDEIPGNGMDDDGNGFVDDIRGWDFGGLNGTPDNDPMEDRPDHGTHVAGDASAVTDNSIGISSIGFRSKIMPVKTIRDDLRSPSGTPFVVYGYEGIVYAVNNGAQVINCSWGGGGYSLLGQEVINYAIANGSLVVAAAGNNNSSDPFYPASYKNVLSVAATDEGDMKTSFSNYGAGVDISAPGINIYSTWQNDTYRFGLGTSFASPIAAGLAALVKARFPLYNANQIAEQIRTNCDDINSINPDFINQLGRGRLDAFKSLANVNSKSVRAIDVKFSDELPGGNGDGALQPGEIIKVACKFVNYLAPTSNLGIYLESSNNFSNVLNGIFIAGSKTTLDTFTNSSSAYTFQISHGVPQNYVLSFNLNILDGSYQDFQRVEVVANPTYSTQSGNNVSLTITSKGTLAYNDFPNNTQGEGFKFLDGSNLMFEGALMLATSQNKISDAARGSVQGSGQNADFTTVQPFIINSPGSFADVEGSSIINDEGAGINKIGIRAKLSSFTFNSANNQNYILLRYSIKNETTTVLNDLFAGLFFDWDFADATDDFTAYDSTGNLGYAYRVGGNPNTWVGTALVSSNDCGFWAINNQGGDGGFSIYDGFTDAEKWQSLSNGIAKTQAGAGDISHVTSGGPYSIQPYQTIHIAFAIAAGNNLDELRAAIANARIKHAQIPASINDDEMNLTCGYYLYQNYPNPFNPSTKISWLSPVGSMQTLKIFDVLGNEVAILVNEWKGAGYHEIEFDASKLASGIYYYQLRLDNFIQSRKMILLR